MNSQLHKLRAVKLTKDLNQFLPVVGAGFRPGCLALLTRFNATEVVFATFGVVLGPPAVDVVVGGGGVRGPETGLLWLGAAAGTAVGCVCGCVCGSAAVLVVPAGESC